MNVKPERSSTNPYNKVGQHILNELAAKGVTYKYATRFKRSIHGDSLCHHLTI